MTYYLALERKPNSYEAIHIKNTPLGKNLFSNDKCECTLEEIDCYTTQYTNLQQLTHELYCDRFIPWTHSSVAIVYANGTNITIQKDLLFKESRTYLDNPTLVLEYLISELSSCNIEFAKELSEKIENVKEKEQLQKLINKMEENKKYDNPLEMTEVMHLAELLVYPTDNFEHIQTPRLYEYSKIHNIVLTIAKYETKLKENKQSNTRARTKNTSN